MRLFNQGEIVFASQEGQVPKKIRMSVGRVVVDAELADTPNAQKIWDALPIRAEANTWGDEIYFTIPVTSQLDQTAKELVEMGDIGYWPTGKAFCVFFGPTPMSKGNEIRPASAVNIVGKCHGDLAGLKSVHDGDTVTVERGD